MAGRVPARRPVEGTPSARGRVPAMAVLEMPVLGVVEGAQGLGDEALVRVPVRGGGSGAEGRGAGAEPVGASPGWVRSSGAALSAGR